MPAALFSYFSGFAIGLFHQLKQDCQDWGVLAVSDFCRVGGGEPQCGMQLPAHGLFGQTANGIRTNELKRPHKIGVQNPSVIREKSVRQKSGCPCRPRAWMGYAYGSLVTSQALAPILSIARNGFNLGALLNGIKKKKKEKKWGKKMLLC